MYSYVLAPIAARNGSSPESDTIPSRLLLRIVAVSVWGIEAVSRMISVRFFARASSLASFAAGASAQPTNQACVRPRRSRTLAKLSNTAPTIRYLAGEPKNTKSISRVPLPGWKTERSAPFENS